MNEQARKTLKRTTITLAISFAALVMGGISIFLSIKTGSRPWIGVIVVLGMGFNIFTVLRTRRAAKDALGESNPKL